MMDLFTPVIPENAWHANFRSVMLPRKSEERNILQYWADGFPDRDGKFVREFQSTFNSSFWEIYLHATLNELGFSFDWNHNRPDFYTRNGDSEIIIEAAIASNASGKEAEWERRRTAEELIGMRFDEMNRESIIRLANAFTKKTRKYKKDYFDLPHVRGKPFVLAIAPFEQPNFNLQYNRPVTALLYNFYVHEDAFLDDPEAYPNGPPTVHLDYVEKDNGAEIELGVFCDNYCSEVSAILFSCTATWGKVDAMAPAIGVQRTFQTIWGTPPNGTPEKRISNADNYSERIWDGLQIYHNPHAKHPIDPSTFRAPGVVQVFGDPSTGELEWEGEDECLMYRQVINARQDEASE